jgi:hypothetical protein
LLEEQEDVVFVSKIALESLVDVIGLVKAAPEPIKSATQQDVEVFFFFVFSFEGGGGDRNGLSISINPIPPFSPFLFPFFLLLLSACVD